MQEETTLEPVAISSTCLKNLTNTVKYECCSVSEVQGNHHWGNPQAGKKEYENINNDWLCEILCFLFPLHLLFLSHSECS